jgi:hypothetical protein
MDKTVNFSGPFLFARRAITQSLGKNFLLMRKSQPGRPYEFVKKSPKMLPNPFFAKINA